jgi:hypothetical protein
MILNYKNRQHYFKSVDILRSIGEKRILELETRLLELEAKLK